MNLTLKKILTFIFIYLISTITWAQSSSERPWLLSHGAAAREAKRFNLYDWLEEKNRNHAADLWLSLNTAAPYEFMIGVTSDRYSSDDGQSLKKIHTNYSGEITAYAKLVGLTAEYQNNTDEGFNDTTGLFNLRLFGETIQGTHLTVHYGLRTRKDSAHQYRLNQQFYAGTLQLYLIQNFGVYGQSRYFPEINESYYGSTKTKETFFGAFIDFSSLRVIGSYFIENQNSKLNGVDSKIDRSGSKIGLQLFF